MIALPHDFCLIARCVLAAVSTAYGVHCHIPHHATNTNVEQKGGGGLMLILDAH
jgi:hypothetical protein